MIWSNKRESFWNASSLNVFKTILGLVMALNLTTISYAFIPSQLEYLEKDTLRIVAFGNSITAERATVNEVFAQRLPQLLEKHGIESSVINSGIGGSHTGSINDNNYFKIKHGRDRFETDVMSYEPAIVIIGFGTNDCYIDSKTKNGESRLPIKDYKSNLKYFITRLKSINSKIIFIAPNILGAKFPDFQNKRLLKYVKVVRKLAKRYNTGLVDNHQLFQEYEKNTGSSFDDLMLDGVHPNDKGHEMIANHLVQEIFKIVKK